MFSLFLYGVSEITLFHGSAYFVNCGSEIPPIFFYEVPIKIYVYSQS